MNILSYATLTGDMHGSSQGQDESSVQFLGVTWQQHHGLGLIEDAGQLGLHLRTAQTHDQPQCCALHTAGKHKSQVNSLAPGRF